MFYYNTKTKNKPESLQIVLFYVIIFLLLTNIFIHISKGRAVLKDFSKINTFLTVARERSFSKASAKIGISQPAVTQQIKYIEEYLQCKILERKKNGIVLTKEGNELFRTATKLEKCISMAEKELLKVINKKIALQIGASSTIGNYILPTFHDKINENLGNEVIIHIGKSADLIEDLQEKKIDIALIEAPVFEDGVHYREWLDDEIVMFSNKPLPKSIKPEDMSQFNWMCREEGSHTRKLAMEAFESVGIDCATFFDNQNVLSDATAIKQTILHNKGERAYASMISKFLIEDEVKNGQLFITKIKGFNLARKFYIAYLKENKHDAIVINAVNFLMKQKATLSI